MRWREKWRRETAGKGMMKRKMSTPTTSTNRRARPTHFLALRVSPLGEEESLRASQLASTLREYKNGIGTGNATDSTQELMPK